MAANTAAQSFGVLGGAEVRRARDMLNRTAAAAGAMSAFESSAKGAAAAMQTAASAAAKTAKATAKAVRQAARYVASFDEIERMPAAKYGGSAAGGKKSTAGKGGAGGPAQAQLEQAPSLLNRLREALAAFWAEFAARLAPAAAAWTAAWQQIRQTAGLAWQQITAAAGALWNGTLAPLLNWLGQVFVPGILNAFSQAFAPIAGDVLSAAVQTFAVVFQAACAGVQSAVQTVLAPALALVLQVWQGLMAGVQAAWAEWGQPILTAAGQAVQNLVTLAANLWATVLQPVLQQLIAMVQTLWQQHLQPLWNQLTQLFGAVTAMVLNWWNNVLLPFLNWLTVSFGPLFSTLFAGAGNAVTSAVGVMADAVGTAMRLFQGIAEFLSGAFAGDWAAAWRAIQATVADVWTGIQNTVRSAVNSVIGFINGMLQGAAAGINAVGSALNHLNVTIPDWVPGLGGNTLGFHFGTVTAPQIPYLASGGVIRQPTLAMMGEYAGASGDPEIAAPQSAIGEAVASANGDVVDAVLTAAQQIIDAIRENGGGVVIGDEVIGRAVRRYNSRQAVITGGGIY